MYRSAPAENGDNLRCKICGDVALGHNYNVLTCNSCKSFFRRHAHRDLTQLRCLYDDVCEMTPSDIGKRRCLKCRLKKCLDAGMNKELIHHKDHSNDCDGSLSISCELSTIDSPVQIPSLPEPPITCEWELPVSEFHDDAVRNRLDSNAVVFDAFMDDGWHRETSLSVMIRESINLDEKGSLSDRIELADEVLQSPAELTDDDQILMTELEQAATIFFQPVQQKGEQQVDELLGWSQYQTKEKLTRVIEFTKSLPAFQRMQPTDQVALIKGGAWEMHIMRCILNYFPEEERFGPNKFGDYYDYPASCNYLARTISAQLTKKFLSTLDPLWCENKSLVLFLIACILFDPRRPALVDRDAVGDVQRRYHATLYRYLLVSHSPSRSKARYSYNLCMRKMDELSALNQAKIDYLAKMQKQHGTRLYIDPLLQEVFTRE